MIRETEVGPAELTRNTSQAGRLLRVAGRVYTDTYSGKSGAGQQIIQRLAL